MFRKLGLVIFFYAFLNTVVKTEGGLITNFRKFREYTNIRSNDADEKSVQGFRQSENTAEQDDPLLQLVKQLKKNQPPIFTGKTLGMTMTTVITAEKSKRWNMNGFEGKGEKRKSLIKVTGRDDRPVEAATVKSTGLKHIGKASDKGQPVVIGRSSSISCGTRRSVATITGVGDQTADPNQMTPLMPFTPRTRTQPRLTSTDRKRTTKKWRCNDDIEDEPATEESNSIGTVWQDITLPTRLQKYQTPIDPVTKFFLKMTSYDRWRRKPSDKCTTPYLKFIGW